MASASLRDRLAVGGDEPASLAPARGDQAVARPRAERAEQHHLAQREDADAEEQELAEEAPPGDHRGVLVELRRQRGLAVGVVGRHRVPAGDDLVAGQVAAPEGERETEAEQREGQRAAEPGVARVDDEADDEADRPGDGRDDPEPDGPGRRRAGRGPVRRRAHGVALRDGHASQTARRMSSSSATAPTAPSGTGPRYPSPARRATAGRRARGRTAQRPSAAARRRCCRRRRACCRGRGSWPRAPRRQGTGRCRGRCCPR